jgi:murein DD-endopeptidase MepM/ murein hydrolase activator NlpD
MGVRRRGIFPGAAGAHSALYQFSDLGAGAGGGAAALRLDPFFRPPAAMRSFGSKVSRAIDSDFDLVTDLGVRIGSGEWFRGLATCAALCYAAWSFAPGFGAVPGAVAAPLPDAQWEEARALSISPLAFGADTGRRMAPTDSVEPLTDTPERPSLDLVATLGRGDGFARVLERAGVAGTEAGRVSAIVAGAVALGDIKPGTTMEVTLGRRPNRTVARPLDALSFRARFDLKLSIARAGGQLVLTRTPIAIDSTPLRIQGQVGSSLYRAARAAGAPAKAVEAYIRAVAGQVGIGSLNAGDRFDIILEHRRAATGETESGRLLYAGLDRSGGKDLQLLQWPQGGRLQWFEASGVGRQSGILQRPVPGSVSSNYGMRRHPILGYSRMHRGIDFRAGYGTPILAATDGRVTAAGWAGGYGRQVRISHGGGLSTSYSHMSRIVAQPGTSVRQGQVIGYVGSTGLSTGPHLHYELYQNGVPVNPASVRFVMRAQLSGGELASFRGRLRNLLSVPVGAARAGAMASAPKKVKPTA